MPRDATIEEIEQAYMAGWKLGVKACYLPRWLQAHAALDYQRGSAATAVGTKADTPTSAR